MSEALWVHFHSIYLFPTKKVLHINKNIFLQGILSFLLNPPNVVDERKSSQETRAGGTILNVLLPVFKTFIDLEGKCLYTQN